MELTGLGGGVMLAIAAVLWLAYLLPSWFRSREYLATEKNAVRLQQTIRVLAETSEVQRTEMLRSLPSGPVAVGRPVRQVFETPDRRAATSLYRLRRTRLATAFVLLVSVVVGLVQVGVLVAGAGAAGSWLALGASALGALSSVAMLGRLAQIAQSRRTPAAQSSRRTSLGHAPAAVARQDWTPVPIPRPMYLSRAAAPAAPFADPRVELELAAAAAEQALRDIEQPPAIAPALAPAAASTSRFASMGIVDAVSSPGPDIDAALANRRRTAS
ncbi:MAG: hypothetical protein ABJA94_02450 [Rhodoglobus sp.]